MTPDKYQQRCLKTWLDDTRPMSAHLNHMAMGMASEVGEFVGLIDKNGYKDSANITRNMMLDELGDVFYYVAIAAYLLDTTIDELDQMNAEKLVGGHGWVDNA